ncbi:MAG: hypothetical protein R3F61_13720 [Myxococcota bacterium]
MLPLLIAAFADDGITLTDRCGDDDIPACEALLVRDLQIIGAWLEQGEQPPLWRTLAAHTHKTQLVVLRYEAGDLQLDRERVLAQCVVTLAPACRRYVPHPLLPIQVEGPRSATRSLEGRIESWLHEPRAGIEVWLVENREGRGLPDTFEKLAATRRAVARTTTDAAGRFRFDDVEVDGDWGLWAIDERENGGVARIDITEEAIIPIQPHKYGARRVAVLAADGSPATEGWLSFPNLLLPVDGSPRWVPLKYGEMAWDLQLFGWGPAGRTTPIRGKAEELPLRTLTLPDGPPAFCSVHYASGDTYGLYDGPCIGIPWTDTESLRDARWTPDGNGFTVTLKNDFLLLVDERTPLIAYRLTDAQGAAVEVTPLGIPTGTYQVAGWLEPGPDRPAQLVNAKVTLPEGRHRVLLDAVERTDAQVARIVDSEGYPVPGTGVWARSDMLSRRVHGAPDIGETTIRSDFDGWLAIPPFADGHRETAEIQAELVLGKPSQYRTLAPGETLGLPKPVPDRPWPAEPPDPSPSTEWVHRSRFPSRFRYGDATHRSKTGIVIQVLDDVVLAYLQVDGDHLVGLTPRDSRMYVPRAP